MGDCDVRVKYGLQSAALPLQSPPEESLQGPAPNDPLGVAWHPSKQVAYKTELSLSSFGNITD